MRRRTEQALAQRHRAVDIDDHGNAATARFVAEVGAEASAATLDQDGVAILEQHVCRRQFHLPQFGIAERDDGALAGGVHHDAGDRRHQAGHVHQMRGVDTLFGEVVENILAGGLARVAHRAGQQGMAAEPVDADRGIQRIAATDLRKAVGVEFLAAAGDRLDAEGEVAYRHADAQDVLFRAHDVSPVGLRPAAASGRADDGRWRRDAVRRARRGVRGSASTSPRPGQTTGRLQVPCGRW